jgi:hypothetical protein
MKLTGALDAAGIGYEMWSRHGPSFPDPPAKVLVVDTVGDLASLYASGDLGFGWRVTGCGSGWAQSDGAGGIRPDGFFLAPG